MTTEAEYKRRVSQYTRDDLLKLWTEIQSGTIPSWEKGKALEYLVLRAFEIEDADVIYPYSVEIDEQEIEQIDGFVYTDGLACLIECKDQEERINIEPVAKMRNQLLRRPSSAIGVIFSRSGFTDPAIKLTQYMAPQAILLWGGQEIEYAIEKQHMRKGLKAKFANCVAYGNANYDIREEQR